MTAALLILAISLQDLVGFDPRLGDAMPLEGVFVGDSGRSVRFGDLFDGKPVVLAFVYYRCPMLCGEILNGAVRAFEVMPLEAGRDFRVIAVSFDPLETAGLAAAKKAAYLRRHGRGDATGWHFLTGSEPAIQALAQAAGFRYRYDAARNEYAHGAGILVLSPQGRISSYFSGLEYPPRDLRWALVEAGEGKIGTTRDRIALLCMSFDPVRGKYTLSVLKVLRGAAGLTVLALGGLVAFLGYRGRRSRPGKTKNALLS